MTAAPLHLLRLTMTEQEASLLSMIFSLGVAAKLENVDAFDIAFRSVLVFDHRNRDVGPKLQRRISALMEEIGWKRHEDDGPLHGPPLDVTEEEAEAIQNDLDQQVADGTILPLSLRCATFVYLSVRAMQLGIEGDLETARHIVAVAVKINELLTDEERTDLDIKMARTAHIIMAQDLKL